MYPPIAPRQSISFPCAPSSRARAIAIDGHRREVHFALLVLGLVALLFAIWTVNPPSADAARRYVEAPIDPGLLGRENSKTLSDLKKDKTKVLRGSESFSAKQKDFDRWYRKYVFPAMTRQDQFEDLADMRVEIIRDLANARDETARKYLLALSEKASEAMIGGNFHPAVRYNAALLLGELNDREATVSGRDKVPPVPKVSVLPKLLAIVDSDKVPDAVHVAAILGITRHANLRSAPGAEAPIPPAEMAKLVDAMSAILLETELPKTRSIEAHTWIRGLAAKALSVTGQVGEKGAIYENLLTVMKSDEEPVRLRCDVAAALGTLPLAAAKPPADELIKQMGVTLTKACEEEVTLLDEMFFNPNGQRGFSGFSAGPSRRPPNMDPDADEEVYFLDEQTIPIRQRLMYAIDCLRTGLGNKGSEKGVASIVSAAQDQQSLAYLIQTMDVLAEQLADTETTIQELHGQLYEANEDLQVAYMGAKSRRRGPIGFAPEEPAEENPEAAKEEVPDFGF